MNLRYPCMYFNHYQPQQSCGQGYVFTCVCDSVHRGGVCHPPPAPDQAERTPPDQAGRPPQTRQGEAPPDQADPPPPPWTRQGEPPRTRENPPRPGRENPPPGPGRETPPDQAGRTPPGSRLQHTVNERPVRILLECILVSSIILKL